MSSTGVPRGTYNERAIETVGDDVWVVTKLPAGVTEVPVGDQLLPLPPLDYDPTFPLTLLERIDASGAIAEVRVLGANLVVTDLASDGVSMLAVGHYYCNFDPMQSFVFDAMGVAVELPQACDQLDDNAARGYVLSLAL